MERRTPAVVITIGIVTICFGFIGGTPSAVPRSLKAPPVPAIVPRVIPAKSLVFATPSGAVRTLLPLAR